MHPLVSIIIPTYNRAHFLGETLESIISQYYRNWECIVIDDGSIDATDKLMEFFCERDSRFRYYHRPKNLPKGANSCRNYGFELCRGEFVNWFDSDDVMMANFLETKLKSMKSNVNIVICSGYYADINLKIQSPIKMSSENQLFKGFLLWEFHILTPSVLFRKAYLEKKFIFSTIIERGQEAELFSRLFYKIPISSYVVLTEPLFYYRQHSKSISTQNEIYIKKFKESESYFYVENLKKSIVLNDYELINFINQRLIHFFFLALKNRHFENARYILNNLISAFQLIDKNFCRELMIYGKFFLILKRGSYRIERRWKKKRFNFVNL